MMLYNLNPDWADSEREVVIRLSDDVALGLRKLGHPVHPIPLEDTDLTGTLRRWDPAEHVLFNWCEEIPGIQHSEPLAVHTIDDLDFVYTGSTHDVLMLCEDKPRIKEALSRRKVPVPRWGVYTTDAIEDWDCFPAIVKAAYEHSSVGMSPRSVVTTLAELRSQVQFILTKLSQPAVVEDFIDGREFHVSLWGDGNGGFHLLPPVEMDFSRLSDFHQRLCSYDAKFSVDSFAWRAIETRIPAVLSTEEQQQLAAVCIAASDVAGCRDYARIDVRQRNGIFYVLDVNPNPDLSADASMACAAETVGYAYPAMLSRLICLAARRHPRWREDPNLLDMATVENVVMNWFMPMTLKPEPVAPQAQPDARPARRKRLRKSPAKPRRRRCMEGERPLDPAE